MRGGWSVETIGDVCSLSTGGTPKRAEKDYFEDGEIKWLVSGDIHKKEIVECDGRISQLGLKNSNAKYLPENSVMIALNGQGKTRGTVAMLRTKATCNQSLVSIMPNDPKKLLPEYLFANLHGRYDEIRKLTGDGGNDRRGLNMPLIRKIKIPIAPLSEQKRIVAVLDEAFEGIDLALAAATKNLKNARELFETTLNTTFTQKGEGWVETTLGEVGKTQTGTTPKTSEKDNFGTFIPFVKPADFQKDGSLNYENMGLSEKGLTGSRLIFSGSALMVCIGATIGKAGFSEIDVAANQQVNAITPKAEVSSKFVYYQMITRNFQSRVLSSSGQATLPIINKSKWSNLAIALAPTMNEQLEVVAVLDSLSAETQRLETLYQQKIDALKDLKQSLLQRAFTGELTADPQPLEATA